MCALGSNPTFNVPSNFEAHEALSNRSTSNLHLSLFSTVMHVPPHSAMYTELSHGFPHLQFFHLVFSLYAYHVCMCNAFSYSEDGAPLVSRLWWFSPVAHGEVIRCSFLRFSLPGRTDCEQALSYGAAFQFRTMEPLLSSPKPITVRTAQVVRLCSPHATVLSRLQLRTVGGHLVRRLYGDEGHDCLHVVPSLFGWRTEF